MNEYAKKKDIVFDALRSKIASGEYPTGFRFPSEPQMAKELQVGRVTLRSALKRLEDVGLITRIPSKGTFVNDLFSKDSSKSKTIWLVYRSYTEQYFTPNYILPGVEKQAVKMNLKTQIMDSFSLSKFSDQQIKELIDSGQKPSGIVLLTSTFFGNEPIIDVLKKIKAPVIIPHTYKKDYETTGFAVMAVSLKNVMQRSLEYLQGKGHYRVATLGFKDGEGNLRMRGFQSYDHFDKTSSRQNYFKLLKTLGLSTAPELLDFAGPSQTEVSSVLSKWLSLEFPPTAVLCYSDYMAELLSYELKNKNIKVPEQIALMGICGMPQLQYLNPPVSTMDFDYQGIGAKAIDLLINSDKWFHPDDKDYAPPFIETPFTLIERKSTQIKRFERILV